MTEAEFLALPETEQRMELLDGDVILSPAPTNVHQVLVGALHIALHEWAVAHPPAFVGLSPFDVRIAPNRVVQPDLFLLFDGLPSKQLLRRPPDLVIEALSTNRSYDRLAKRLVYAEAGVGEYWIVDARLRRIEVVAREDYRIEAERCESAVASGLGIDLPALFAPLDAIPENDPPG